MKTENLVVRVLAVDLPASARSRISVRFLATVLSLVLLQSVPAQYPGWQHSGSLWILTTPEGANLPDTACEHDFPLLVRLTKETFDFRQAQPHGEDLRVSAAGQPLPYQIDFWDATNGTAGIWVKIPEIKGNARQEIKLHWGNATAASESNAAAVFNAANGYVSVFHMDDPVKDDLGTVTMKDVKTTTCDGLIGAARHFVYGQTGILQDKPVTGYPLGSAPNSFEAWFRPVGGGVVISRGGNWQAGRVVVGFSPLGVNVDCYGCGVTGKHRLPVGQWMHVMHTYQNGDSRLFLNGELENSARHELRMPDKYWMAMGCYAGNLGQYAGEIDEVRVSNVARSADWIRLQYENQKPLQTLAGLLVPPGNAFAASPAKLDLPEGGHATVTAQAGGAQRILWTLKDGQHESLVAVDTLAYTFDAGRVTGNQSLTLQWKVVCANGIKTKDIPIAVKETIPEPVFTLQAAPIKIIGRFVRRSHQSHAPREQGSQQLAKEHGVGDIDDVEFIQTQQAHVARPSCRDFPQRILSAAQLAQAGMYVTHETVEMDPNPQGIRQAGAERVDHESLAAAHPTP